LNGWNGVKIAIPKRNEDITVVSLMKTVMIFEDSDDCAPSCKICWSWRNSSNLP
jgi:hypothetical protein